MKKAKGKSNIDIVKDMQAGIRPFTQVGYEAPTETRKVGDVWEDAKGKSWIKTEYGVRSHNPKADLIKQEINKKWTCKRCGGDFRWSNNPLDEKMLNKTGMCFNCVTEYETELRILGKFADYEKKKILQNQLSYVEDMRKNLRESYKYTKGQSVIKFVNSNGHVEEWANESRIELMQNILSDYKECCKSLKLIEDELKSLPEFDTDVSKKFNFVPVENV